MRKIIAAFNMTLDGNCDHTAGLPDADIHNHYTELLNGFDAILYGRITYELMEYWRPFVKNPTGEKSRDDFAMAMDKIQKIVFSRTLTATGWDTAELADRPIEEIVAVLKQQPGKDILVGSRSLIVELTNMNLIDEYQLCINPVIASGKGLSLFENVSDRIILNLTKTKIFNGGSVILYYERANEK